MLLRMSNSIQVMEKQEKKYKRIEELDEDGVATLLQRWELHEFVEFTREKQIDGKRLLVSIKFKGVLKAYLC